MRDPALDAPAPPSVARRAAAPRVVLHIGRNKAGSTSIQDFCLAARPELAERGVDYALFGHLAHSMPGVPGFATFEALAAHAGAHPHRTQLVSNEFMFGWPDEYTRAAAVALSGCDVRVLAYLRPYDAWIVSAYAEETRKGMNTRNIDAYLAAMAPRVSAWPHLRVWGETFGWDRLRVRTLDAASLHGGALPPDFVHALGVAAIAHRAPPSNAAPPWPMLELVRRLAVTDGDVEWIGVPHEEAEPLVAALSPVAAQAPRVAYLSRTQRAELRDLYDADLDRIAAASGDGRLPSAPSQGIAERAFIPAWVHAPDAVKRELERLANSAAFARDHPAAAARARSLADDDRARAQR